MASVGEEFPREQARCRRLILDYIALPNGAGALGARMIEAVLQGADRSIASGDPKKIARDLKLMKEYQWEFEKRPNGIPVPSEEIDASLAPAFASERPGLARLLEWARAKLTEESAEMREYPERGRDAFEECVDEIEREIAAIAPLADDLRTPEPGAFEGAYLVGVDLAKGEDVTRLSAIIPREAVNSAVREALAELRDTLTAPSIRSGDEEHFGIAVAVQVLDRFAERFR